MGQAIESRKFSSSPGVGQGNGHKKPPVSPGAEPALSRRTSLASSGVVALGFAFAGGCGTNNARRFMASVAPEDYPYLFILVANTDGPQLKEFFDPAAANSDLDETESANLGKWIDSMEGTKQLTIIELGESGSGAGGDPEIGRIAAEAKREEFEQWMKPLRAVVISGGAGKGTGGGALPVIQRLANGLDKSPLTIVTMPFAYEGGGRMKKAIATLKALYEQGPTMPIYNENAPRDITDGKGFREIFNDINNASIQPVFLGIREVTQVVGDMQNVDIADWRRVLSVGNYVNCDYTRLNVVNEGTESAQDEELKAFTQRLFRQDPYQDHRTRRNASGMLAWAHGAWKPEEVKAVVKTATDELNPGIAADLEVFPGIHIGDDGKKWMMILSVAAQGPDPASLRIGNGEFHVEGKSSVIYVPVEGQNTPAEVVVNLDIAKRWKMLYYKRNEELTPVEREEFNLLMEAISERAGKSVFCPR
jgi:cell division GTPase FtsZ